MYWTVSSADKTKVVLTRIAAALLLVLLPTGLLAQRYGFKLYDHRSGLPNLDVRALLQDTHGFLWVGTDNGLYRYDGERFLPFGTLNGLPSPQIESLHETGDGTLWAVTPAGIARMEGDHFQPLDLAPVQGVYGVTSDRAGTLYVATSRGLLIGKPQGGKKLQRFSDFTVATPKPQLVKSVAVSRLGQVWYTCNRQLCRVVAGEGITKAEWEVPEDSWEQVGIDPRGNVWARSRTKLIELPDGGTRFEHRDQGLPPSANIGRLMIDRSGQIWVPTARGLARRKSDGWELIGKSQGLPFTSVRCALQDREGSIWVGLNGAGLARWLGYPHWETWTDAEGLTSETVWAVTRDRNGVLWAGGENGISRFVESLGTWQELKLRGLPAVQTTRIVEAPDGALWLGQSTGAVRIDPERREAKVFGKESGILFPWISSLTVDAQNRVWAGTPNGLFLGESRGGSYTFAKQDLKLEQGLDRHYASIADRRGRIWVGTWGGLLRLEGDRWIRMTTRDGLASNRVAYLTEARDGTLWIGYLDAVGVSQLTSMDPSPRFEHYSRGQGLWSDKAVFIGSDSRGWIWVGSDQGVQIFDGRKWRHLDRNDGLAWDDCDGNSFHADADGSVWIGTSRALSHLRIPPTGLPQRTKDVDVRLISAQFGDRTAALNQPVSMPWSHRSLRMTFTAMTFVNEDSLYFRYRIAGLDDGWTETRNREVHIPSLPSGSYVFEAQAAVAPGQWAGTPAQLAFTIEPAWWRTRWFTVLALAALGVLAHQLWAWRMRSMLRRQRELELAVAKRTKSLKLEKAKVERERDVVADQKIEIERLFGEARQASRLKDEFLANMSHELRTPMNGIIGMTELALGTPLNPEQREYLQAVRSSSSALLTILSDILDLSKVEAGKLRLDAIEFDLREVVKAALGNVSLDARQKRLELTSEIDARLPQHMIGDPLRLRQVLINLLSNAVKFTEKGRVSLEVAAESEDETLQVHFVVADTGIGIPADQHTLIFEPFLQADGSHTRRYGGTGLGLTICARFVEMMQGRIWVESESGKGSRFHFTARLQRLAETAPTPQPACQSSSDLSALAAATSAPVPPPPQPGRSLWILLAEDNVLNQKLALRLLEKRGHRVVTALNGAEAVSAFEQQRFDAVLMDIQMPVMSGFEATVAIRALERQTVSRTPIIAVTAHAMEGDRERCLESGMDDYVAKPIRPDELFAAIERQVARRPAPAHLPGESAA